MFDRLNTLHSRIDPFIRTASRKGIEIVERVQSYYYAVRVIGLLCPDSEKRPQPFYHINFKAQGFSFKPAFFFWRKGRKQRASFDEPYYLLSEKLEELPSQLKEKNTLLEFATRSLPLFGILKQDETGFVYLDISSAYITSLSPLLQDKESEAAPYLKHFPTPGAHIPVFTAEEAELRKLSTKLKELGQVFHFEILDAYQLKPNDWEEMETVYFLAIKCPALEELRERYLLPPTLQSNPFQITFAVKRREHASAQSSYVKEFLRINVGCLVA
jgi:hypothetical protein